MAKTNSANNSPALAPTMVAPSILSLPGLVSTLTKPRLGQGRQYRNG